MSLVDIYVFSQLISRPSVLSKKEKLVAIGTAVEYDVMSTPLTMTYVLLLTGNVFALFLAKKENSVLHT